jgi:hypothetical protein
MTKQNFPCWAVALLAVSTAWAQEQPKTYRPFTFDINGGILKPQGPMRKWKLVDVGGVRKPLFLEPGSLSFLFGYRPVRFFQLDAGIDLSLGSPTSMHRTIQTTRGEREVVNNLLAVPFGGRLVLPLFKEHFLISAGGGAAFLRNNESGVPKPTGDPYTYEVVECTSCQSRSGWGPYGLVQVLYVPGKSRRFGIGCTGRWTQAQLTGGFLPNYSRSQTKDNWLFLGATMSVRF